MPNYKKYGFKNREEYLMQVSVDHNVPLKVVKKFASQLGKEEDFDGLIRAVEDSGFL